MIKIMETKVWRWFVLPVFALLMSMMFEGCATEQATSLDSASDPSNPAIVTAQDNSTMNLPKLEGLAKVEMVVNGSPILIEVDGENAPITAGNFVDLVERGVYDGLSFHRVVKEPQPFVVQGGDPQGNGTGGFVDPKTSQRRSIPLEIKLEGDEQPTYSKALGQQAGMPGSSVVLEHDRGAVAMARSQMPDSASSQFYFALSDLEFLNGDYAVFGHVIEGMDVVDNIKQGDRIESAKVVEGAENLKK